MDKATLLLTSGNYCSRGYNEHMTTDERLDRLTERHQALAQSLQLLTADVQDLYKSTKELRESMRESMTELRESAKAHDTILRGHASLIGDLVRIATAHEQRLQRLEG
jgi:peptidoglycan hydrolase CwlO-like protein